MKHGANSLGKGFPSVKLMLVRGLVCLAVVIVGSFALLYGVLWLMFKGRPVEEYGCVCGGPWPWGTENGPSA